jgi:hypothetical protein
MREKLELLSDSELIQIAGELTQTTLAPDAICRNLIPEGTPFVFSIIEINAHLAQVLAERLKAYSPYIVK